MLIYSITEGIKQMDNIYLKNCLIHGLTPHYKNGKCKLCVKYQRIQTRIENKEYYRYNRHKKMAKKYLEN